jgi:hypothetical protein
MRKLLAIMLVGLATVPVLAQVKSSFIYNTSMPYGTLDLRTSISSTDYYYLLEGKTFAFRESSPGVRTNRYRDMTSWESNPYLQGQLRRKAGSTERFIMNYRLLPPMNYSSTYSPGYPLIVVMHGGVERGNCYYQSCWHADWNYDPNVNSPRAPTASDHRLLNNDYQLVQGGKQHLDARNLAGGKLPNDPTLSTRAFPGFVLFCQMFNEWNPESVEHMIRVIRLHCAKYRIDQNRIYIHGLSIGGYAVYEAIKRAPWLFAAALPMSSNKEARIFADGQQSKLIHIPIWIFQGGKDTNPTPTFTKNIINQFRSAGAIVRYTEYATLGHVVWNNAYAEADFFSWMLGRNIANIHAYKGIKTINRSTGVYPKLYLPPGFYAYQWQRNGVNLTSTGNSITVTSTGTYRARFSRVANPTSTQWNRWSSNVTINETTTSSTDQEVIVMNEPGEHKAEVFPNPTTPENINVSYDGEDPIMIRVIDPLGRQVHEELYDPSIPDEQRVNVRTQLNDGLYIVIFDNGVSQFKQRVFIKN